MKVRIYQLARDLRISSDALVNMVSSLGVEVKSHMSSVDDTIVVEIKAIIAKEREIVRQEDETKAQRQVEKKAREDEARKQSAAAVARAAKPPAKVLTHEPPAQKVAPPKPAAPTPARRKEAVTPRTWRPSAPRPPGGGRRDTRRRRKGRPQVDEKVVRESVRRTIADLDTKRRGRTRRRRKGEAGADAAIEAAPLQVTEFMTVSELASVMEVNPTEVISACLQLGILANINRRLDKDVMCLIAAEFECELEFISEYGEKALEEATATTEGTFDSMPRSPVVTVMGHVDHGKTSLLDYIRNTRVVAGESGGITQHIGAYGVMIAKGRVTFLDTPGHEAFTQMRARGAQVTDIVVLVVAADDRVMPQTLEAINHARAADVPIVVAITKIDLPGANPDRIRAELAEHKIVVEQYGGKTVAVDISSKTGEGIDKLLEMLLLEAELLELKAEPDRPAKGVIIESELDPGKGVVATVLVQNGTVRVGDPFVCGIQRGKVRVMVDDTGARVTEAGPATPVEVWGWSGIAQAGDTFHVSPSDQEARDIASRRTQIHREHELRLSRRRTLVDISQRIKEGEVLGLTLVIKGDATGSVEVLRDSLEKLSTTEVQVRVIHQGVGAITEGDVLLAVASEAIVIGFHVKPDAKAQALIQTEKVDVRLYKVIYEVVDEVRSAMGGLLAPELVETTAGVAEVRKIFRIKGVGVIAGCMVTEGTIHRSDSTRLRRNGEAAWEGKIGTLKRFKDDAREVASGFECGIGLVGRDDIIEGDLIEAFSVEEIARKLE